MRASETHCGAGHIAQCGVFVLCVGSPEFGPLSLKKEHRVLLGVVSGKVVSVGSHRLKRGGRYVWKAGSERHMCPGAFGAGETGTQAPRLTW